MLQTWENTYMPIIEYFIHDYILSCFRLILFIIVFISSNYWLAFIVNNNNYLLTSAYYYSEKFTYRQPLWSWICSGEFFISSGVTERALEYNETSLQHWWCVRASEQRRCYSISDMHVLPCFQRFIILFKRSLAKCSIY